MKPIKILIYSGNFYPENTGIGKYTGEMAEWLSKRGHQVEVVTGFPYYPDWKLAPEYKRTSFLRERWGDVLIHRLPHYIPRDGRVTSLRRILVDLTIFLSGISSLLRVCLRASARPDVIVAVSPPLLIGIWPQAISRLFRVPWIYHIQDFQIDAAMELGMLRGKQLATLLLALERWQIRSATKVSSITPAMKRRAISKGASADQIVDLPNWSDIGSIKPLATASDFRRRLGLSDERFVVMYAGAIGRKQGLELVVDAAERLADDSRFHFVMIGSGSDAESLKAEVGKRGLGNMTFLPIQPLEHLNDVLNAANVHLVVQKSGVANLVMPSKLTNALASGRPVIATADPGTDLFEAVETSGGGIVIPPEDLDAMVAALVGLASDPGACSRMSVCARSYAEQNLDKDNILGRFEADLLRLVDVDASDLTLTSQAVSKDS